MAALVKKMSKSAGLVPGTLVHIGEKKAEQLKFTIIDYNQQQFQEKQINTIEECFPFKDTPTVTWINIDGISDVQVIEKVGERFGLHPLILEDIVNTGQRPKLEDFESYIFVVLKMLSFEEKSNRVKAEQVSLILGPNFVISFQEKAGDVFSPIRERIRGAKGRIRKMAADYLAYSLIDAIVDNYFAILEKLGGRIEGIEEELISNPNPRALQAIYGLKRQLISLRKSVWPLREVVSGLQRSESVLIQASTGVYLRDVYDHTIQVIDTIETFRDMVSGMLDIYLSSLSNKMNEVMKVLTIIATLFIPLTFVAGIYGMNFKYMPELNWPWGYAFVWMIIGVIASLMIGYFKRKKWL